SDQFVYWNGRDPQRCMAPDAFVYWGTPDEPFPVWKTWERGTPQLAVEIASSSDRGAAVWESKLELYQELGVRELVRFDAEAAPGARLRVWDRTEDDLVERDVTGDATPCVTLSGRESAGEVLY
ncbi:Uma2 family endonuclease, partial [Escherichia coli]|nr:Uma2 family endonuclease [Escherichia coli]